jgi:hypothetical protein
LILNLEFDQHLGSHKHVINIIMGFRDMGCYIYSVGYLTCLNPYMCKVANGAKI